jgi:hypothetical protein
MEKVAFVMKGGEVYVDRTNVDRTK